MSPVPEAAPLLLLAAPGRESRDKAAHFAEAAAALGLPSRLIVTGRPAEVDSLAGDAAIDFALTCSDALALPAARLNERHGCGGLPSALVATLVDKATGIPFLSRQLGLPLLPQCLPQSADDIARWSWPGGIIVKPTRSSGAWSPRPWGYRRFAGSAAFLHWLRAERLEAAFFAEQRRPGLLGPSLLQAVLETGRTEAVLLLHSPTRLQPLCRVYGDFEIPPPGGSPRWRRVQYGGDAAPELMTRLAQLETILGRGRGLLYLQGLRGPEGFHLIDINLRLSSGWDWTMAAADATAHRRLLAALLFDTPFDATLPAPAVALDLVHGEVGRTIAAIDHPPLPPHLRPLRLTPDPCRAVASTADCAALAPAFVTLAADAASCIARADAFRAGLTLHYAPEGTAA